MIVCIKAREVLCDPIKTKPKCIIYKLMCSAEHFIPIAKEKGGDVSFKREDQEGEGMGKGEISITQVKCTIRVIECPRCIGQNQFVGL